jgi:hypothetical protein
MLLQLSRGEFRTASYPFRAGISTIASRVQNSDGLLPHRAGLTDCCAIILWLKPASGDPAVGRTDKVERGSILVLFDGLPFRRHYLHDGTVGL